MRSSTKSDKKRHNFAGFRKDARGKIRYVFYEYERNDFYKFLCRSNPSRSAVKTFLKNQIEMNEVEVRVLDGNIILDVGKHLPIVLHNQANLAKEYKTYTAIKKLQKKV